MAWETAARAFRVTRANRRSHNRHAFRAGCRNQGAGLEKFSDFSRLGMAKKKARTAKMAGKPAKPVKKTARRKSEQAPVEVYFWPTPNGFKITMMLEECGLPYVIRPVNIGRGDQFKPDFLAISPNNRMPAIVDPNGPGGKPISVFESGAILQYLGRKTGKFYPANERKRTAVEEWLFWQVGGVGPMAGQAHHFRSYAPEKIPYAIERYTREVGRLYGIIDKRVAERDFLVGEYSIADMAVYPWAKLWERQGQDIKRLPNFARWLERMKARPAVARGIAVRVEEKIDLATDEEARRILFGIGAKS
jgi:GST-like protein